MISWEEAEQIMGGSEAAPIKSSLPPSTRPSEPDNDTDVLKSIAKLEADDPSVKLINLNNMKRTPVPQIKRLIEAMHYSTHVEKLQLANMGLYDNDILELITLVEHNTSLKSINLETNYLSGEFFQRLFEAALVHETLEEIKCVNQGVTFATTAEKEIIRAIYKNQGLTKISINFRLPEGRHKVEQATLRNGEIKRMMRRQAIAAEAEEKKKAEEAKKATEKKPVVPEKKGSPKKSAPGSPEKKASPKKVVAKKPQILADEPEEAPKESKDKPLAVYKKPLKKSTAAAN
uniref:Tropomodulin n=1 Tax=Rhabditophanes sp. KR3021 TaxID=114890 RepID=A0AC35UEB9_9BILA